MESGDEGEGQGRVQERPGALTQLKERFATWRAVHKLGMRIPQAAIHGQVHLVARRARAGPHAAGLRAAGAAHGGQPHTGTRRAGVACVSRGGLSFSSRRSSRTTGELLAEVPRQPPRRGVDHLLSALLKRVQIVERVDTAQPAGVDQTHVDVADLRAAHRFVEQ